MNTQEEMPEWAKQMVDSMTDQINELKREISKINPKDDFSDIDRFIKSMKEIEGIE